MNDLNQSILTLILLVPIAGAILIAVLPDRGKLSAWLALLTALVTFGLTLHLPAHFGIGQPGYQFEFNRLWIDLNPNAGHQGIFYHVGVDGLSLWLVVLTGLLAPVGVLASWNAIKERRKIYYSLFLVQQTAMFGVFVSLDLMVYYGFWELSLVPMAILIAMYGRKDGPHAAGRFFLFTFIPSAPLLVAILYLYARTGTFNFSELQLYVAAGAIPSTALFWCALAFLFAFAVKVPVFPLHGWLAETFSEAPVALAMVVAGKLGLYSMLRFHVGLFPDPGACHRTRAHRPRRHRHSLRRVPGPRPTRLLASHRLRDAGPLQRHHPRHLRPQPHRPRWRDLPDGQPGRDRRSPLRAPRRA